MSLEADYNSVKGQLDDLREALKLGEASDGHHTHNELYEYRLLYNAHTALAFDHAGWQVVRSWKHADGEDCFGGGWFVVHAETSAGQITNHYRKHYWRYFDGIAEEPTAPEWDGHTPEVAALRLEAAIAFLRQRFTEMSNRADLMQRAYARVCGERDKYMRRTAEWRSAALEGHDMPDNVVKDVQWALSELGQEHWDSCDIPDDEDGGCYVCNGYKELKEKYPEVKP